MTYPPQGSWDGQPQGQQPGGYPQQPSGNQYPGAGQQQPYPGQQYPQQGQPYPQQGQPYQQQSYQQQQQGYPQPGYGYPYGPPQGPRRNKALPWILGGVGAVVVLAVVLILVFTLGGGKNSTGSGGSGGSGYTSAQALADDFVKAAKDNKEPSTNMFCSTLVGKSTNIRPSVPAGLPKPPTPDYSVSNVEENGDSGSAVVRITPKPTDGIPSVPVNLKLVLKKENGWKICDLKFGL